VPGILAVDSHLVSGKLPRLEAIRKLPQKRHILFVGRPKQQFALTTHRGGNRSPRGPSIDTLDEH